MFALEVEFLTGVSVAATPNRREEPEWPPHPDRLFQALVAAWGRNDQPDDNERRALEWFEGLQPPEVSAPSGHRRDPATYYVPPNDARTVKDPGRSLRVIPEFRKNRQARAFPAFIPAADHPVALYIWHKKDGFDEHRTALASLAAEVTYLGHSHTLVRIALVETVSEGYVVAKGWTQGKVAGLRLAHRGRLNHLVQQYNRGARPKPSLAVHSFAPSGELPLPTTIFDAENVTVLSDDGGFAPALEAFPLVARRLRDSLLDAVPAGMRIPALLSGHDANGQKTNDPHLAMAPLADVGWAHSSGRLMGLALLWPRNAVNEERKIVLSALAAFLRRGYGELHFGRNGSWRLALEVASNRASLRIDRYTRASRQWATVLPAVLDRYPKSKPREDLASIIAQACLNIGLPREAIDQIEVEIHKHAAPKAAPSARQVWSNMPEDSPYRNRPLVHLVITFAGQVCGPVILGAGRFRGLGFCLPLSEDRHDETRSG